MVAPMETLTVTPTVARVCAGKQPMAQAPTAQAPTAQAPALPSLPERGAPGPHNRPGVCHQWRRTPSAEEAGTLVKGASFTEALCKSRGKERSFLSPRKD